MTKVVILAGTLYFHIIIRSLFCSLGLVPDRHFWCLGLVPKTKIASMGLVPKTKNDSLGLDVYWIYTVSI